MVRHSEMYQKFVRDGMPAGRFVSVAAAEYLSGLPKNWTSSHSGAVDRQQIYEQFPDSEEARSWLGRGTLSWKFSFAGRKEAELCQLVQRMRWA